MNKYLKAFLHRGMLFSGLGPIVLGIVYSILSVTIDGFALSGAEVLLGIISTYLIAFVQAGASVFNQIEHWSLGRSLLMNFLSIYLVYAVCYLVNSWIPFDPTVILIFTAIFIVAYFAVWLTVYLSVRRVQRRLNGRLGS